jgi:hypothetical protein
MHSQVNFRCTPYPQRYTSFPWLSSSMISKVFIDHVVKVPTEN